jgi:hypothetical protein
VRVRDVSVGKDQRVQRDQKEGSVLILERGTVQRISSLVEMHLVGHRKGEEGEAIHHLEVVDL